MNSFDVVVVGSCNTDLSVFTQELPNAGETVMGSEFLLGFGGKGANQAVAAKLLGSRVCLIAKVGIDSFGSSFIEHLNSIGVAKDGIRQTTEASTGVALITVEKERGENRIVVVPGANMLLSEADLDHNNRSGLLNARVLVCQFEISVCTTLHALKLAKARGMLTILNPAPMIPLSSDSDQNSYIGLMNQLLSHTDYCCPNETEAVLMVSRCLPFSTVAGVKDINGHVLSGTIVSCLRWMAEMGVSHPIVTLGSQGVVLFARATVQLPIDLPPDVRVFPGPDHSTFLQLGAPLVSDVVDTSGAGDCFVGALAHFVSCYPDLGPIEHLRRAVWVATQSVKSIGTQSSFSRRDDLPLSLFASETFSWPVG